MNIKRDKMIPTEKKSKQIWNNFQKELQESQKRVDTKLKLAESSADFLKYLKNNSNKLNILDVIYTKEKYKQYGKLIITPLIFTENGRLYMETAYYPLSTSYFSMMRLSISDKIEFSRHYMERLIERKNIISIKELKHEIGKRNKLWKESNWAKDLGGLDVSTAFILVYRDSVSFCDFESSNIACVGVFKTFLPYEDLSRRKKEIVDYILNKVGSEACFLATHDLPDSINEADNIIESTRVRTHGPIEDALIYDVTSNKFKQNKKSLKNFVDYLETYDPTSLNFIDRNEKV